MARSRSGGRRRAAAALVFALPLGLMAVAAPRPAAAELSAPVPVRHKGPLGSPVGFVGWTPEARRGGAGVGDRLVPEDPALAGAALVRRRYDVSDLAQAVVETARSEGVDAFEIDATTPAPGATVLDQQGRGATFIGAGRREGRRIRMVAFAFYGDVQKRNRITTVRAFLAPEPVFEGLGGWTVVGIFWFGVDLSAKGDALRAIGSQAPERQTRALALASDAFHAWLLRAYVSLRAGDLRALNNARVGAVCASIPGCRVAPGPNGFDQMEIE